MALLILALALALVPGMNKAAKADSALTAALDESATYEPTTLPNGDWETQFGAPHPHPGWEDYRHNGNCSGNYTESGWGTTDDYFEIYPPSTYNVETGNHGKVAEMNAFQNAILFQDLDTTPGDIIMWKLEHAARWWGYTGPQSMKVSIGGSDGNSPKGTGAPENLNVHITPASLAEFTSAGVQNPDGVTLGYANADDLSALSVTAQNRKDNPWHTARGVYIIPAEQTKTRFAFVSLAPTEGGGNILDNITFQTLLGNMKAVQNDDSSVTITGYWGSSADKSLKVKIGSEVHSVDMSAVADQNFTVTIPSDYIEGATEVTIYHEDYESAAKVLTVITKPNITADDVTATYGDTTKSVIATTDGNGAISYAVKEGSENYIGVDASTGALTIKEVPADGKAYVTVTAAATDNYRQATKEVTVNIKKADWTKTKVYESAAAGIEGTVGLAGCIAPGGELDTATLSRGSQADDYPVLDGNTLKFKFADDAQGNETIATITIPVTGATNYNDYNIIAEVSAPAKVHQTLTFNEETVQKTYGDVAFTNPLTQGHEEGGYGTPYGTVSYSSSNEDVAEVDPSTGEVTIKKAGRATITADATRTQAIDNDKPGYLPATASYELTVSKADPIAEPPTDLTATYGQTLDDVELPNPEGNTPGTWTWAKDGSTSVGDVGEHAFKAHFTPDDKENYNSVNNVDLTVTVEKADGVPATVAANNRTYDGAERPLVTVTGQATGGTMCYFLGKSAPEEGWVDAPPAATDAGTYTVWYKVVGDKNHNDTEPVPVDVAVEKKAATVKADDKSKKQGEKDPDLTATVSGEVGVCPLSYSLSRKAGEDAGTYAIDVTLGNNPNYEVTATPGTLTIEGKAAPAGAITLTGSGHVQNVGDVVGKASGKGVKVGTEGRGLRLEALSLALPKDVEGGIEYRGHVQNKGWQGWAADGRECGTRGRGLRLEAVQVRLTGKLADTHSVWYRAHVQNLGTLGWSRDGQAAGTAGRGLRVESLEVCVLPTGEVPESGAGSRASFVGAVGGSAHSQNVGWAGASPSLSFGTTGRGLRLEAVRLNAPSLPEACGISYEAHVQNVGWQGARTSGKVAGTTGRGLRTEAVRISLTGEAAKKGGYSVWYRVHSQNQGWLGWAHDGADAGTVGRGLRAEAVQVQVLPQGQVPAGYDASKAACVR